MRHRRSTKNWQLALGLPIALILAGPAGAKDPGQELRPTRRAAEILAHVDEELESKPSPFTRLGLNTRHGITYRHSLELAGRRIELRVNGPVQRRKTFGLRFKFEF